MLKAMLLTILVTAVMISPAVAQLDCLIFSEYVEGSSFNKAVEIYNATGEEVNLSRVELALYTNGSSTASATFVLADVLLASGANYVVAHPNADAAIIAVAAETSTALNFNGDDAFAMSMDGVLVDCIGEIGFDPGSGWGTEPLTTVNHTLRRLITVCCGDKVGDDPFDPAGEWAGFDQDTFDDLGSHVTECQAVDAIDSTWGQIKAQYR